MVLTPVDGSLNVEPEPHPCPYRACIDRSEQEWLSKASTALLAHD